MEPQATQTRSSAGATARLLAVFALLVAAIVVIVIVADSISGSGDDSTMRSSAAGRNEPAQKYYVVQPGDTFGGIAHDEGVSVSRLEKLNPNLDTQLLPEKGCVNLVPKGCKVLANGG